MERNAVLIVLRPGQARTSSQFMHLGLRTGATVEVGVATDRRKIGITTCVISVHLPLTVLHGASSEIVIRDAREGRGTANTMIIGRAIAHTIMAIA